MVHCSASVSIGLSIPGAVRQQSTWFGTEHVSIVMLKQNSPSMVKVPLAVSTLVWVSGCSVHAKETREGSPSLSLNLFRIHQTPHPLQTNAASHTRLTTTAFILAVKQVSSFLSIRPLNYLR